MIRRKNKLFPTFLALLSIAPRAVAPVCNRQKCHSFATSPLYFLRFAILLFFKIQNQWRFCRLKTLLRQGYEGQAGATNGASILSSSHERGAFAVPLALFVILILIVFFLISVNSIRYFAAQSELRKLAREIASNCGPHLPNVINCHDGALPLYAARIRNVRFSGVPATAGATSNIKFYVTSARGDMLPYNGDDHRADCDGTAFTRSINFSDPRSDNTVACGSGDLNGRNSNGDLVFGTSVDFPVKSVTVKLVSRVQLFPFNLARLVGQDPTDTVWDEDTGGVVVRAESTVRLVPADVVLVVENSPSMQTPVNPTSEEPYYTPEPGIGDFQGWDVPLKFRGNTNENSSLHSESAMPGGNSFIPSLRQCEELINPDLPDPPGYEAVGNPPYMVLRPRQHGEGGMESICESKGYKFTAACFGESAYNIKRAAVLAYDLLSASGTYRVGAVHTFSTDPDQAPLAVPLVTHPTYRHCPGPGVEDNDTNRAYSREGFPGCALDGVDAYRDAFGIGVDPNAGSNGIPVYLEQPQQNFMHHDSICAAITDENEPGASYPVPFHPFTRYMVEDPANMDPANDYYFQHYSRNLKWIRKIDGVPDHTMPLDYYSDRDNPGGPEPFRFKSTDIPTGPLRFNDNSGFGSNLGHYESPLELLPREILWMKYSGGSTTTGVDMDKSHSLSLALTRAMEVLENSAPRKDLIPVTRKIILVLADGFDVNNNTTSPISGDRYGKFFVPDLGVETYKIPYRFAFDPSPNPNPSEVCDFPLNANLESLNPYGPTSDPSPLVGVKIGFLMYGFSGPSRFGFGNSSATWPYGRNQNHIMPFHELDVANSRYLDFLNSCKRLESSQKRGAFIVTHSPQHPVDSTVDPADYWRKVIPEVARSLHQWELVN